MCKQSNENSWSAVPVTNSRVEFLFLFANCDRVNSKQRCEKKRIFFRVFCWLKNSKKNVIFKSTKSKCEIVVCDESKYRPTQFFFIYIIFCPFYSLSRSMKLEKKTYLCNLISNSRAITFQNILFFNVFCSDSKSQLMLMTHRVKSLKDFTTSQRHWRRRRQYYRQRHIRVLFSYFFRHIKVSSSCTHRHIVKELALAFSSF